LSDSASVSPDLPELRLLAQLAGLRPASLAAAVNDPDHFSNHISAAEMERFLGAQTRVLRLTARMDRILTAASDKNLEARGLLKNGR
jgi:hypothetical protein